MNSPDPWNPIVVAPDGEVVFPRPYYGHPFYREVPSWVTPRDGATRLLFDGAFIGAEALPSLPAGEQRTGLTAEVAPVLAPATGGFTSRVELDDRQRLHAEICVDGKCYKGSIDLAPAISALMAKFAQYHRDLHKAMPSPSPVISGDVMISRINQAVSAAGDALVGALLDHHTHVACAGWLDDIGHAIGGTLRTLKPVISIAATGVATAFGGPAAGAVAGQLVGPLTDVGADALNPQKKTPAQAQQVQNSKKIIAQAKEQAKTDPVMAKALAAAHRAVAHTTVAYHVKETVQKAAQGDPVAQQRSQQLAKAADQGDPAAQSAMDIAKQVLSKYEQNAAADLASRVQHSQWGAHLWEQLTGRGPATVSGW
jgi:hypothetical protein